MNSSGEKKKRHAGLKVLIVIAVLVFLFLCLIGFITDFLWFKELDYVSVFLTKLLTQLKIGIPTFIVVTFLAYVYLKFLKRGYFKKVVSDEVTDHRRLNIISWSLAGIYGAITTFFTVKKLWFLLLQFVNSTGFDKKDPLYNIDISFYVFKLDFIEEANQLLIVLLIAFALLTVIYYSVLLSVTVTYGIIFTGAAALGIYLFKSKNGLRLRPSPHTCVHGKTLAFILSPTFILGAGALIKNMFDDIVR